MILYICDAYATSVDNWLKGICETDSYSVSIDTSYSDKTSIDVVGTPNVSKGDFVFALEYAPIDVLTMNNDDVLTMNNGNILTTDSLQGSSLSGIVESASEKDGRYTITFKNMTNILNRKIFTDNLNLLRTNGIEDWIADVINNQFKNDLDRRFAFDYLTINVESHTYYFGNVENSDGVGDFVKILSSFLSSDTIRLVWSFNRNGLNLNIVKGKDKLIANLNHPYIINSEENITSSILSRLNVRRFKEPYEYDYTYVLLEGGNIVQDETEQPRVLGETSSIYVKENDDDKFKEKIRSEFAKNTYTHKITFSFIDGNVFEKDDFYVGRKIDIISKDGSLIPSEVSRVKYSSSSNIIEVECGSLDILLTDKIRRLM